MITNFSKNKKEKTLSTVLQNLLQNVFKITTRSSPASLIGSPHGIPHAVEDSWQVDKQRHQAGRTIFGRNFEHLL